ncbi:10229_t:CDS:10, partial [Racocetra persica]
MSLKKLDSSLSESSIISKAKSLISLNDKQKSKSSNFLSTSLCDNFIDLTAASSEASDHEIPEIYIDDLMQTTDNEFDIINIHNFFTKNFCINKIQHSLIPIEYPPTSSEGIAIIYNISKWNDYNIQYNMGDGGGNKIIEYEYLGCKVNKSVRMCTGAKVCEFVSSELKETQHSEVNADIDFYKINQPVNSQISKEAKTHASNLSLWKKSDDDIPSYFIGCTAWAAGEKHTHHRIDENEIDIIMLEKLFKDKSLNLNKPIKNCHTILSTSSHKKECYEGLNRKRKIIKLNYNVKFIKLVPLDIKTTPFVVLICQGIHTHPAPPPVNIPTGIQSNLEHIINEAIQIFERVTPKKILSNNLLKAYFLQQKQFPYGQGLLGIATEFWNGNKEFNGYLQEIGWKCILGDLDQGQAKGLGLALANIKPKYTWNEHLTYIFKKISNVTIKTRIEEIFNILKQIDNNKLEGGFGYVYSTTCSSIPGTIALKEISVDVEDEQTNIKNFLNELKLHSKANHDRIIKFFGASHDEENELYYLVLEFAECTLRNYLSAEKDTLRWTEKVQLAIQIAEGVQYIHCELNVAHRDLVIINNTENQFSDFGLSRCLDSTITTNSQIFGIAPFIEPQKFKNKYYKQDKKSDIYSLGVIFWEISSCCPPFCSSDPNAVILDVCKGIREKTVIGTPKEYVQLYSD